MMYQPLKKTIILKLRNSYYSYLVEVYGTDETLEH